MESLKLPFNLPANLLVTQWKNKEGGTHTSGKALDLQPVINGVTYGKRIAIYIATFLDLFSHLSQGVLRMNVATAGKEQQDQPHFHYVADADQYTAGLEFYHTVAGKSTKYADKIEVNMSEYSFANLRLAQLIDYAKEQFLGGNFSISYWGQLYEQSQVETLAETFVFYNPEMVSGATVQGLLSFFTKSVAWTPFNAALPAKPSTISAAGDAATALLMLAGLSFALQFFNAIPKGNEQNEKL